MMDSNGEPVKMEYVEPDRRCLKVHMQGPSLYVARLQPYRISDLEKLKTDIAGKAMVEITPIGHTVEGRELEIIRVGSPDAPHRVLIRAPSPPLGARRQLGHGRAHSSLVA